MRYIILIAIMIYTSAGTEQPKYFYKKYEGKIGSFEIMMDLVRRDTSLEGSYYYKKYKNPINLSFMSSIDADGNIYIEENNVSPDENWDITGSFSGKMKNDMITGTWYNVDSSKSYPFVLKEYHNKGSAEFGLKHHYRARGDCESGECAEFTIEYPLMKGFQDKSVQDSINNFIRKIIYQDKYSYEDYHEEVIHKDIDELSKSFFDEFSDIINESGDDDSEGFYDYPISYYSELKVMINLNENNILSLSYSQYFYTGGAHGNYFIEHHNFDLATGTEIRLDDLLDGDYKTTLDHTGENQFRDYLGIGSDESLNELGGCWFPEDKFQLNDNFSIRKNGLVFQFNQYEIAPYAVGAPEVFIPFSTVNKYLNQKFIQQ